ncbi:MAG: hypothetical protein AB4352_13235 [Hormoscilla sp.]
MKNILFGSASLPLCCSFSADAVVVGTRSNSQEARVRRPFSIWRSSQKPGFL